MTAPTPNAPAGEREDLKVGERRFYRLHTNYGVRWREDVGEKFGRVPLDSEMALLDALLAARREVEEATQLLDGIRKHCRVVYYFPHPRQDYPIEHAPHARKDCWDMIRAALAATEEK